MKLEWKPAGAGTQEAVGEERRYVVRNDNGHWQARQYGGQQMLKAWPTDSEYNAKGRCQAWENAKRYSVR